MACLSSRRYYLNSIAKWPCFFVPVRCNSQWLSRQLRRVHGAAEAARPHHGTRPPLWRPSHPRLLHVLQERGHEEGGVGDVRVLRIAPLPVRVSTTIRTRHLAFEMATYQDRFPFLLFGSLRRGPESLRRPHLFDCYTYQTQSALLFLVLFGPCSDQPT